ncbi:4Fe-4S ferredoxin [Pontibacter sp. BAB1700]|nr:4Fe-4S ferredoxin [Pontibacter sp. BAB1700]
MVGLVLISFGLLGILVAAVGADYFSPVFTGLGGTAVFTVGALLCIWQSRRRKSPAEQNHGLWQQEATSRGASAWVIGFVLTGFYVLLYWFPDTCRV